MTENQFIYVVCSDGDLEEGVTSEASSIAGRQDLGNLIVFYDHNEISIEDDTNIAFDEDVPKRYESYGWHVQTVEGGENVVGILEAIEKAKAVTDKPSFIQLRTIIGYPAPNLQNTGKAHGAALGDAEIAAVKKILGFDPGPVVPGRRRGHQAHPAGAGPRRGSKGRVAARIRRLGRGEPGTQGAVRPDHRPGAPGRLDRCVAVLAGRPEGRRHPGRRPARCCPPWPTCCPSSGAVPPTSPSRTTPPWPGRTRSARSSAKTGLERAALRPDPALRDPRTRDGLDPDRDRHARSDPPVRRHVPDVLRLHAWRGPVGRGDGCAGDLRLDARLDRPR